MTEADATQFVMHGAREVIELSSGAIHIEQQVHALESAVPVNPGLAFDLAKSLIETVCKTIATDRGMQVNRKWDTPRLFKETLRQMRLLPEEHPDAGQTHQALLKTARGLQQVIQGLCELRNLEGFASHGQDGYIQALEPLQAQLAARAADAVVHFLYRAHKAYFVDLATGRLHYEDQAEFNEYLDESNEIIRIFELVFYPSQVLFHLDEQTYRLHLDKYQRRDIRLEERRLLNEKRNEFDTYLDDVHELVQILGSTFSPSEVLYRLDRIAYDGALAEYVSEGVEDKDL